MKNDKDLNLEKLNVKELLFEEKKEIHGGIPFIVVAAAVFIFGFCIGYELAK